MGPAITKIADKLNEKTREDTLNIGYLLQLVNRRDASNPVDKGGGLRSSLLNSGKGSDVLISVYDPAQTPEEAWVAFLDALITTANDPLAWHLLLDWASSETHWYPTWDQMCHSPQTNSPTVITAINTVDGTNCEQTTTATTRV